MVDRDENDVMVTLGWKESGLTGLASDACRLGFSSGLRVGSGLIQPVVGLSFCWTQSSWINLFSLINFFFEYNFWALYLCQFSSNLHEI